MFPGKFYLVEQVRRSVDQAAFHLDVRENLETSNCYTIKNVNTVLIFTNSFLITLVGTLVIIHVMNCAVKGQL